MARSRTLARFIASVVVISLVPVLGGALSASPATAPTDVDPAVTAAAVDYLRSQQIGGTTPAIGSGAWDSDPAFEFVTSEAVLAIAEGAQTTPGWSASAALAAVQAADNADGVDPLPFLDLVAALPMTPGKAAKLVLLVAGPLGLDPTAFDPAGDGSPVDLMAAIGSPNPDGSFGAPGFFNGTLLAALALKLVDGSVPVETVAYVRAAQKANGGWSFDADPGTTTDAEIDTTSFAMQALVAGGAALDDADVREGLVFVESQRDPEGTWSAFGSVSVEAISRAILAIVADGFALETPCWRDTVDPASVATPYVSPDDVLAALQQPDGSIAGPGVFSAVFATAQAVQGLERGWLPLGADTSIECAPSGPGSGPPPVLGDGGATPGSATPRSATPGSGGTGAADPAVAVTATARFTG